MISDPLWKHQEQFVALADQIPNVAFFAEPGTGKTRAAIEALRREFNRAKRIKRTLIICPLSTCKQWAKAFETYSNVPQAQIKVLTGTGDKRLRELAKLGQSGIAITNFEFVRVGKLYPKLREWAPEIVIVDESHRLKDPASEGAKKIYPVCHAAQRRILLTGTPILNSLLDIYGQYQALDPNIFNTSAWQFKQKYFYDKNAAMPPHIHFPDWQPKREAEYLISQAIAKTSLHAKKSECLDLPPLVTTLVPVELSGAQRKAYDQMEKEFVAEFKDVVSIAEFAMTKSLRLQQILAGFVSENPDKPPAWFDDNPRMDALRDILERLNGEQVIIWTNFAPTFQAIGNLCERLKLPYSFLTGLQSVTEKELAIKNFACGASRVLISNPAAGGTGVDGLQCSRYSIYYTRSFNLAHFWQSRDRNHRGGSEVHASVTHYHLMAEDTVDEVIYNALLNKQKLGEALHQWARNKHLHRASVSVRKAT